MNQVIVIPARMGGTRLPGKPLIKIKGKEIIQRTWEQCVNVVDKEQIFIATEDSIIKDFCDNRNMQCILTEKAATAIDRIKLFSDQVEASGYINVQGDEPLANPQDIREILRYNMLYPNRIVFGKTDCSETEFRDYSKAKVVCDASGRLIYDSRSGIPACSGNKFKSAQRAIWIYAFNKASLDSYYSHGLGKIEGVEDTEIIRFLEIGLPVYCHELIGNSWAVDEPKDIDIVANMIEDLHG